MKAIVIHRPERQAVDIYLFSPGPNGGRIGYIYDGAAAATGGWLLDPVPEGGDLPITLRLSDDALAAIVTEAMDVLPPSREQATALTDARTTRDRLLSLVEHMVTAPAEIVTRRLEG